MDLISRANPQLYAKNSPGVYSESLPTDPKGHRSPHDTRGPSGWEDGWGAFEAPPSPGMPGGGGMMEALGEWNKAARHILGWYHDPDMEAIRICSAIALSHYATAEKATWTFLIGESGTGKTDLCIKAFSGLPKRRVLSEISAKAFQSGMGNGDNSLLRRSGHGELWLFKDFTTILSERDDDRKKIIGTLREIWDGEVSKETGGLAQRVPWKGKITCIIACTPALERYWGVYREMGERFLITRWREPRDIRAALASMRWHRGNEKEIEASLKRLMGNWISTSKAQEPLAENPEGDDRLMSLAILASRFRVTPHRDHNHRITDIPRPEFPSRLISGARAVRDYHARLFRKPCPDAADCRLAERILWNTIPRRRLQLIEALPRNATLPASLLQESLGCPKASLREVIEDMEAQGYLERHKAEDDGGAGISWTPKAYDLLDPIFPHSPKGGYLQ